MTLNITKKMVYAFICERCEKQRKKKVDNFNGGKKKHK
jgi:hypothetical protein